MIKIASLFSGIGGFEKGVLQADPSVKIVFASEFDQDSKAKNINNQPARIIYHKNFKEWPQGDITKIKSTAVPEHDILMGGPPCQDFSSSGKRAGLCGTRGRMFHELIRIAREKQPKLLLIENVKGLLNSSKGWDFASILIELEDAGYKCEWQVLNTKMFLPQNRERVFVIGHLRGAGTSPIFPLGESSSVVGKEEPTVYCLDANYYKGVARQSRSVILSDSGQDRKPQLRDETFPPLRANTGAGHNNIVCHSTLPRSSVSGNGGTGHLQRNDGIAYCLDTNNNIAVEHPLIAKCLTGGAKSGGHHSDMMLIKTNNNIRRLTPIECERLQGFPDNWTEGISDTQRYKCLGNAVTVNVVEYIFRHISQMLYNTGVCW